MLKSPVRAQKLKYRREDRMEWTRAAAKVACQCTNAKVQEGRQDGMGQELMLKLSVRAQTRK